MVATCAANVAPARLLLTLMVALTRHLIVVHKVPLLPPPCARFRLRSARDRLALPLLTGHQCAVTDWHNGQQYGLPFFTTKAQTRPIACATAHAASTRRETLPEGRNGRAKTIMEGGQ